MRFFFTIVLLIAFALAQVPTGTPDHSQHPEGGVGGPQDHDHHSHHVHHNDSSSSSEEEGRSRPTRTPTA